MGFLKCGRRVASGCSTETRDVGSVFILSLLVSLTCLFATGTANAQSLYGTIVGVVTDPSEAVVPDAKIEATQTETNEKRTATTDNSGFYALTTVPAGTYVVSISKSGFHVFEARGINLTINTTVRVDAKLALGGQQQTMTLRLYSKLAWAPAKTCNCNASPEPHVISLCCTQSRYDSSVPRNCPKFSVISWRPAS
jgi:Carboxypeptidase regulatory-like domain